MAFRSMCDAQDHSPNKRKASAVSVMSGDNVDTDCSSCDEQENSPFSTFKKQKILLPEQAAEVPLFDGGNNKFVTKLSSAMIKRINGPYWIDAIKKSLDVSSPSSSISAPDLRAVVSAINQQLKSFFECLSTPQQQHTTAAATTSAVADVSSILQTLVAQQRDLCDAIEKVLFESVSAMLVKDYRVSRADLTDIFHLIRSVYLIVERIYDQFRPHVTIESDRKTFLSLLERLNERISNVFLLFLCSRDDMPNELRLLVSEYLLSEKRLSIGLSREDIDKEWKEQLAELTVSKLLLYQQTTGSVSIWTTASTLVDEFYLNRACCVPLAHASEVPKIVSLFSTIHQMPEADVPLELMDNLYRCIQRESEKDRRPEVLAHFVKANSKMLRFIRDKGYQISPELICQLTILGEKVFNLVIRELKDSFAVICRFLDQVMYETAFCTEEGMEDSLDENNAIPDAYADHMLQQISEQAMQYINEIPVENGYRKHLASLLYNSMKLMEGIVLTLRQSEDAKESIEEFAAEMSLDVDNCMELQPFVNLIAGGVDACIFHESFFIRGYNYMDELNVLEFDCPEPGCGQACKKMHKSILKSFFFIALIIHEDPSMIFDLCHPNSAEASQ
eukprot:GILK01005598.1.p1 GENE.GILK01005598.1~~GILK01005598.1.p1  ORF type:complete len:618 (-),score=144.52 GILK01005598.1:396-2249(-)